MDIVVGFAQFSILDVVAALVLFSTWLGIGYLIDEPPKNHPSVSSLMANYRREWLRNHVDREPRVFDAMIVANMRNGTSFFASGCMLAVGGVLALVGNTAPIEGLASDLSLNNVSTAMLELKLLVLILLLSKAFFNFVWAHRVFGYASVLMGAVPNQKDSPLAFHRAAQSAELNISAAKSFNRGLRTVYFSLAALAWLLGPAALILATLAILFIIWRREFSSLSRKTLMLADPE